MDANFAMGFEKTADGRRMTMAKKLLAHATFLRKRIDAGAGLTKMKAMKAIKYKKSKKTLGGM